MSSLIQKHAHVKGQSSNHHILKIQPNPSWAKKRPNRYTSFMEIYLIMAMFDAFDTCLSISRDMGYLLYTPFTSCGNDFISNKTRLHLRQCLGILICTSSL